MISISNISKALVFIFAILGLWFIFQKISNATNWFTNTTETSHQIVVQQITALGKMELVNYQFKDVVETQLQKTLLPDARVLLIVSGRAVGCIDMSKLTTSQIYIKNDSLTVELPRPELCVSQIDHSQSKVYDTSIFAFLDEAQLVDNAYKKAEEQIKNAALTQGILEQTKTNANKILVPMFEKISGKKVRLVIQ